MMFFVTIHGVHAQAIYSPNKARCSQVTKEYRQCTRAAVRGGYCTQHYRMKQNPVITKPKIDIMEEWQALSTDPSQPDVLVGWRDTVNNIIYIYYKGR